MATLPILKSGHGWRVGNGSSISVQKDRWIPNHPINKILHPANGDIDDWLVSELINTDLHVWRSDVVMSKFQMEDAEAVCRNPLSQRNVPNSIIWLHNKNGMFTVKSAYKVARKILRGGDWAENSNSCVGKKVWAALWKLRLPSKIKVFGWRVMGMTRSRYPDEINTSDGVNLDDKRVITDEVKKIIQWRQQVTWTVTKPAKQTVGA